MATSPRLPAERPKIKAKWLHNPYLLKGPHYSTLGQNQEWPKSGQDGYMTLAFLGVPGA